MISGTRDSAWFRLICSIFNNMQKSQVGDLIKTADEIIYEEPEEPVYPAGLFHYLQNDLALFAD